MPIRVFRQTSAGNFVPFGTYAGASYLLHIYTADVNNDGYPDIICGHNSPSRIAVYLNNGDGTFATPSNYGVTNFNSDFKLGDLDNDGDLDIVAASTNASLSVNRLQILLNNGAGSFSVYASIAEPIVTRGLFLADLDNDRDLDLMHASTNSFGSAIKTIIYENDGNANFTSKNVYTDYGLTSNILAEDLNGDGNTDILSLNAFNGTSRVLWKEGGGDNSLGTIRSIDLANSIAGIFGDFNGKGSPDIFAYRYDGANQTNHATYINDGIGNFSKNIGTGVSAKFLNYHQGFGIDYDNDGDLDIFYAEANGDFKIAINGNSKLTVNQGLNFISAGSGSHHFGAVNSGFFRPGAHFYGRKLRKYGFIYFRFPNQRPGRRRFCHHRLYYRRSRPGRQC